MSLQYSSLPDVTFKVYKYPCREFMLFQEYLKTQNMDKKVLKSFNLMLSV